MSELCSVAINSKFVLLYEHILLNIITLLSIITDCIFILLHEYSIANINLGNNFLRHINFIAKLIFPKLIHITMIHRQIVAQIYFINAKYNIQCIITASFLHR